MSINYIKLAATAQKLVIQNGRSITLIRNNETPIDPARPWNGSEPTPDTELIVPAVQLMPNAVRVFGLSALGDASILDGLISLSEYVYVVFAGENDLHQYSRVLDEGVYYSIQATQSLRPATTTLVGYIGVRR